MLMAMVLVSILLLPGCTQDSDVTRWRMAASWPTDMLFYSDAAEAICDRVAELSRGRFIIEPCPAGEITGALDVFDAVSEGQVECAHTWPGYWRDREPSFELFTSIPNQMVQQEWIVWLYGPSGGIELWQELYASYGVVPFPGGMIGPEFGFFTSVAVQSLADFEGLRLRVSGMAADVVEALGASAVLVPGDEIRSAMESGEIDGFEFSTPAVDWPLGFQEVAPYVTLPSWHQPSAMLETIVSADAWDALPDDLKAIFESACKEVSMVDFMAGLEGANADYLSRFEEYGTQLITLDSQAMETITETTNALADQLAAQDSFFAEVLQSQRDFMAGYRTWEQWGDHQLYPDGS